MIVKVEPNQTLFDVALQVYGTLDGVWKLLEDNTVLFDKTYYDVGVSMGEYNASDIDGFTDITAPLQGGQTLKYDSSWNGADTVMVKKLKGAVPITAYAMEDNAVRVMYYSPTGKRPAIAPSVFYDSISLNVIFGDVVDGMLTDESLIDMSEFGNVWDKRYYLGNPFGLEARWDYPFLHYNEANTYEWNVVELNYYWLQDMWRLAGAFNYCFAVLDYSYAVCNGLLELYITKEPLTDYAPIMASFIVQTDLVVRGTVTANDYMLCRSTTITENSTLDIARLEHLTLGDVFGTGTLKTQRSPLPSANYDGFKDGMLEYTHVSAGTMEGIMGECRSVRTLIIRAVGQRNSAFATGNVRVGDVVVYSSLYSGRYGSDIYLSKNIVVVGNGKLLLESTVYNRSSTLHFVGMSDQVLSGGALGLNNVVVSKPSGNVVFNSQVNVSGNIELNRGHITGAGLLYLQGAAQTLTGNKDAFIATAVRKRLIYGDSFFMPLGVMNIDMPFAPLWIDVSRDVSITVRAEEKERIHLPIGIRKIYHLQWRIIFDAPTDSPFAIKLIMVYSEGYDLSRLGVARLEGGTWAVAENSTVDASSVPSVTASFPDLKGEEIFTLCEISG